jgi:hypothetical protein
MELFPFFGGNFVYVFAKFEKLTDFLVVNFPLCNKKVYPFKKNYNFVYKLF